MSCGLVGSMEEVGKGRAGEGKWKARGGLSPAERADSRKAFATVSALFLVKRCLSKSWLVRLRSEGRPLPLFSYWDRRPWKIAGRPSASRRERRRSLSSVA